MGGLEQLSPGKDIDFQLNIDGKELIYAGRVYDINEGNFSIEINDEDLREKPILKGMTAYLHGQHNQEEISLPVRIESAETLPILQMRQDNSRTHLRADGFIKIKYKKVLEEQYTRLREQYLNEVTSEYDSSLTDSGSYFGLESDNNTNAVPAKFLSKISFINKEVHFFQHLMANSEEADLFKQKPVKIDISGSGMKINSTDSLREGDLLDIKMILPTSPFYIIKAVGLVIRLEKLSKEESPLRKSSNKIAVKFIAISEDNRESIIRCVFTWQRKNLRERKMAQGN